MITRLFRIPLLTFLLIILITGALMASGWQYSNVGTRARGMAGAYRAISDDWSGVYYNPAGLAFMTNSTLNITGDAFVYRNEVSPDFNIEGYSLGYLDGQTRYPNDKIYLIGNSSIYFKPNTNDNIVFGMSIYQSYDNNTDMNLYFLSDAYNSIRQIDSRNHNSNLDVITFHPAVAMKFSEDKLAIGAGIAIHRADVFVDQVRLVNNPYDYPANVRPYENFPLLYSIDGYGYGVGFNLGLQYRLKPKLTIGASYFSSAKITADGDSRERVYFPYNQGIVNLYDDSQASPYDKEVDSTFGGPLYEVSSQFELDIKLPSEFGIGFAYQASEKVLVSADFAYTLWSQFDDFEIKFNERAVGRNDYDRWVSLLSDITVPFAWDDVIKVSLGVEGMLNETWILRGGYQIESSPIPDETFSPLFMDTGSKHHFTAGVTFNLNESIAFEGALEAVLFSERDIKTVVDFNDDGYWDNFGGKFSNKNFYSSWSLNYKF